MGNKLALAAVVLALLALALQLFGGRDERAASATAVPADLAPLRARIEALEAERDELRRSLAAAGMQPALPAPERELAGPDANVEELARRLAVLEQALEENRASGDRDDVLSIAAEQEAALRQLERRLTGGLGVDEALRRARDPAATEEERLAALRALRGQRLADGTDARLPVLDEMLELARASTDGEARADVWRQLSHVTDRRLLRPLLDALAFDEHSEAREEAAEDLADFLPDAVVEAALRAAMESDPDKGVRRQAGESLAGR